MSASFNSHEIHEEVRSPNTFENPLNRRLGAEFFKSIPKQAGVYFMYDDRGSLLYIGKAKVLRNRLRQYAQAKPGGVPDRTIELVERIARIRWQECTDEQAALTQEYALLRALRPPFNIAGTDAEQYLFIGVRSSPLPPPRGTVSTVPLRMLDFQLSTSEAIIEEDYTVFGCFQHRFKTKGAYTALLRILFACTYEGHRFAYPARLTRHFPPWLCSAPVPADWEKHLLRFLAGKSPGLLRLAVLRLLESESVPRFMYPSLQDDIWVVKQFYETGPRRTRLLIRKHDVQGDTLSHDQMDEFIASGIRLGDSGLD